jgi:hypothetical protein
MSGRHHVPEAQRLFLEERSEDLANAVPPNMVDGLRHTLAVSMATGLSPEDAYASVTEALRALQRRHKPQAKAWLVLEAGCIWLERERKREEAT